MPSQRSARKSSKPGSSERPPSNRKASARGGVAVAGDLACADFVGRDQVTITYGYTAADLERLIEKVLTFLQNGAAFTPYGTRGDALQAEANGETLIFRPGAVQQLAGRRNQQAYLLSLTVQREYQIWATRFIPLAAQMDVRRAVEGLDMPIAFSEFRIPREGEGLEARVTSVPLPDITEAIHKHAAFVILGEPGAGKTTTLQKIAFEAARALLAGGQGRVPLFVRLSQQGERDPFSFLRDEWELRTGTDLADTLPAGCVLLLADGVNELPRDERAERLKAWRLFAADWTGANQIIFTGREKDYEGQLDLPRVRVEPLDDDRIAHYLRQNGAEGLGALLDDPRSHLREMARNPFNLALLVYAYRSNQREMGNRGRLLEWFVGELFAREERLAHRGWLPRDAQLRALAELAFAMQAQGESTTLPLKTARVALPQMIEVKGEEITVKPADLFRFARAATILDPATEPDVRFYHHLLQEYFAALELLRRFDEGGPCQGSEAFARCWKSPRLAAEMPPAKVGEWDPLPEPPATGWETTTVLASGLARDPVRLIEAVRMGNPALAGRCLDEAGIPRPEDVTDKVRADLLADLYDPAVHLRARLQAGFTLGRIGDPRFEPQRIHGVKVILPHMASVPAGTYLIGSAEDDPGAYDDEKPQHPVDLPAFEIGCWPVTNAEYACFIEVCGYRNEGYWTTELARRWLAGEDVTGGQATTLIEFWKFLRTDVNWKEQLERTGSYSPADLRTAEYIAGLDEDELKALFSESLTGKSREQPQWWTDPARNNPSQPVVGVTWFEAQAYCAWLSALTGRVYRLPTEGEWEAASRGLPSPDTREGPEVRVFPWGNEWDASRANTIEGRALKPSPVGAYAAGGGVGPFGAEDQAGNVWEWTSSLYRPYPYRPDEREEAGAEGERAVRGGSWSSDRRLARCAYRSRNGPDFFTYNLGFRVVSPGSISGF
jgi:formylglycine-generating enzyme required for sulfatase activity